MWPFKAKPAAPELQEELQELKSDFRRLRIEWEEVLESLERRAARLRASERHERAKLEQEVTPEPAVSEEQSRNGGRLLTPRQQQIQQTILKRRAGMTQ